MATSIKGEGEGPLPPVLHQYAVFKEELPDYLLLSQTGGFYEAFGEDAEVVARVCNLALTEKVTKEFTTPMAGVPGHSVTTHLEKLLQAGLCVAIAEQVVDGESQDGVLERIVTQMITPGTVSDEHLLTRDANYLGAVSNVDSEFGLALLDVSTGEFTGTVVPSVSALANELTRFAPRELLIGPGLTEANVEGAVQENCLMRAVKHTVALEDAEKLLQERLRSVPQPLRQPALAVSAACVLTHASSAQRSAVRQVDHFEPFDVSDAMILDSAALASLEVFQPSSRVDGSAGRVRTLRDALDVTRSAPGRRELTSWLRRPLLDKAQVERRLDAVELFVKEARVRKAVRTLIGQTLDLERLAARLAARKVGPRDLKSLERTLAVVFDLQAAMQNHKAVHAWFEERRDRVSGMIDVISHAIADEAPVKSNQGAFIRDGYDEVLDDLRRSGGEVRTWLEEFQEEQRERTGIRSLKIGSNNALGMFIEVGKAHEALVPDDFEHVHSLKDKLRYTHPSLRAKENQVRLTDVSAEEREALLFDKLIVELAQYERDLKLLSKMIARIDVYASFAEVAVTHRYVRPHVGGNKLVIKGGRHPVVERQGTFRSNDIELTSETTLMLLTGPNMSGKSTFLRQNALIAVMAQCGSFVPADSASLPIFDRVYTRIGASDDLAGGRSTFFVEAEELATILGTASTRSLVLLDEIGRGTSTYDGLAIATATAEHLHDQVGAFTLFATHYFELTQFVEALERAENWHVAAEEQAGDLVFYHQVLPGPASRSYGIDVARMAGMPPRVVDRARDVLSLLEVGDFALVRRKRHLN